jgi:hypothetical protein
MTVTISLETWIYPLSTVMLNGSTESGQDENIGTHLDCLSCYTYTEKEQVIKYNNILFTSIILQYKRMYLKTFTSYC